MYIIRETFIAKPGMASALAKVFTEAVAASNESNYRVLTDMVSDFNQVVIETEIENLSEYDKRMEDYTTNTAMRDTMKGYTDMYWTGRREIFKVWE